MYNSVNLFHQSIKNVPNKIEMTRGLVLNNNATVRYHSKKKMFWANFIFEITKKNFSREINAFREIFK